MQTIPLCGIFFICTSILSDGYKCCNIKSVYVEELYDADDPSSYDDSYDDIIEEIIVPAGYEYVYIGNFKIIKNFLFQMISKNYL